MTSMVLFTVFTLGIPAQRKGEWEQFTVIGKQVVTIGELERLLWQ